MRVMYTGDSHGCFATWVTQWAVVPHIPPPRACSHHQSISQPRKYASTAKQINLSWLYDKGNHLRSFEHAKTTWWNDTKLNEESCVWNIKGTSAHRSQQQSMLALQLWHPAVLFTGAPRRVFLFLSNLLSMLICVSSHHLDSIRPKRSKKCWDMW